MRSSWLWPGLFGLALLAAVVATGFVLFRRAADVLERELDERLLAAARVAASQSAAPPAALHSTLVGVRQGAQLENAFVLDADGRSVADARDAIAPGERYTALDYDREAAQAARAGREVVAAGYEVEGVPLKSAYVPAGAGRVLVVEASPGFVSPMRDLRRLPWIALVFGTVAGLGFGAALWAARRRLVESTEASLRIERLALAGRLAAQVAHEIRNPLAIVRGSVQLAARAAATGADPRVHLGDLIEEIDRINALVEDFLSLSRDVALQRAACDLNAVAERAASLAEVGARRPVVRALHPAPLLVHADERRLRQALLALLINAFEAAPGAQVEISTGNGADGPWLAVRDDGPGMDPATLQRAGDPFFTTKATGTGLGLSVVRQIAAAHEASFVLDSAPGHGTRAAMHFAPARGSTPDVPLRA